MVADTDPRALPASASTINSALVVAHDPHPTIDQESLATDRLHPGPDWAERSALVVLVLVLAVVIFANSWGLFVPDTKPDLYLAPFRSLIASFHAWAASSGQTGMPNVDTGLAPVSALIWLIHLLGASVWVEVRIWRLLLYVAAAWGARRWFEAVTGGGSRAGRLAVTIFYVANPFVVVIGATTPIMLPYALLPWLLCAHIASMRSPRSWRPAALFALAFAAMSGANSGIVPLFILVAVPCQILWARIIEVIGWRDLWSSLWRCGSLAFGLSVYWIVPSVLAVGTGATIVGATENPLLVALTTSWAEVARMLGNWPLYGRFGKRPFDPSHVAYVTSPLFAAVSYSVPVVAALAAWYSRSRARLLAALLLIVSVPVMVGQFPPHGSLPWTRLVRFVLSISVLSGFRTTTKIGPVVALAFTLCIGVGAVALADRWATWRRPWRWGVVALALALAAASIAPALSGKLWNQAWNVPRYWMTAAATINSGANTSRVLVVPGDVGGNYQWGMRSPDDILPSLLTRPYVTHSTVAGSGDLDANFMAAWDEALNNGMLRPNSLSTIARYLGAAEVLVRNDTRYWETRGAPPVVIDAQVAADTGLRLIHTYGQPGQYTGAPSSSAASPGAAALPPLKLYAMNVPGQIVSAQAARGMIVIDGDGFAVPTLAGLGMLNGTKPFEYMGSLTAQGLAQAAADGATIVLTDTNRRRSWGENRLRAEYGPTLPANVPISKAGGPSLTLFQHRVDTQTVSRLIGAASVVGTPSLFGPPSIGQPWQAFDNNPSTAWLTGGFGASGMQLTIDFLRAETISSVSVTPLVTRPSHITAVRISVGGRIIDVALGKRPTTVVKMPPTVARSLTIKITGVTPGATEVGFSEVSIPGVAVAQRIVLPTDFARLFGQLGTTTQQQLARLPLDVVLTRLHVGHSIPVADEESSINRVFTIPQARSFTISGTLGNLDGISLNPRKNTCSPIGFLDGRHLYVSVKLPSQVQLGAPAQFTSCNGRPIVLGAGSHMLATFSQRVVVDQIVLSSAGATQPAMAPPKVQITTINATRITVGVGPAAGPYFLVAGQTYNAGWHATLDGRSLGAPTRLDGYTFGWRIDSSGPHRLVLSYGPQGPTVAAFAFSGAVALGVLGLLVLPMRRRRARGQLVGEPETSAATEAEAVVEDTLTPPPPRRWYGRRALAWVLLAAALTCFDGFVGLAVALVVGAVLMARLPSRNLILAGAVLLALVPVAVLTRGLSSSSNLSSNFALNNQVANHLAFAGLALVVVGIVLDVRKRAPAHRRSWRNRTPGLR